MRPKKYLQRVGSLLIESEFFDVEWRYPLQCEIACLLRFVWDAKPLNDGKHVFRGRRRAGNGAGGDSIFREIFVDETKTGAMQCDADIEIKINRIADFSVLPKQDPPGNFRANHEAIVWKLLQQC